MGDPDNKAAELKIPVVAIGADDVAMLLAAPTFTMRHGEPEKGPDAWDATARCKTSVDEFVRRWG